MYVNVRICMYMYVIVCICMYMYVHVCVCMYTHRFAYTDAYTYICTPAYTCHLHLHMHFLMLIRMLVLITIYNMYGHIHIEAVTQAVDETKSLKNPPQAVKTVVPAGFGDVWLIGKWSGILPFESLINEGWDFTIKIKGREREIDR